MPRCRRTTAISATSERLAGSPALVSSAKLFTRTVFSGKSHDFVGFQPTVPSGTAMNRALCRPSDQNGAFTEYGITPCAMR